jgi:hypothetical protein
MISRDEKKRKRIAGGASLLRIPIDPKWDKDAIHLQVETEGFIGMYGSSMPASSAKDLLRSFCGLGIALRLFQIEPTYAGLGLKASRSHFIVHRKTDNGWEVEGKFDVEDRNSQAFTDLILHDLDGKLDTEAKKVKWAQNVLNQMRTVFSGGREANRLLRASRWLFDSYTGQDELLKFVQSMVVLEILLGGNESTDKMGLGELLRNRCAYLIAESHQERSSLMADFREIYRVRSEIVHTGKSRLTPHERSLFHRLRWMCRRVIQGELVLLEADLREAQR